MRHKNTIPYHTIPHHTIPLYTIIVPVCPVPHVGLFLFSPSCLLAEPSFLLRAWDVHPGSACGSCCLTQSVMALGRFLLPRISMMSGYLVPEGNEILSAPSLETGVDPILASGVPRLRPQIFYKYFCIYIRKGNL